MHVTGSPRAAVFLPYSKSLGLALAAGDRARVVSAKLDANVELGHDDAICDPETFAIRRMLLERSTLEMHN